MTHDPHEVTRRWTLAQPAVSAFVGSQVRDFRERDDVLQEVAVAIVDSFERYDPERPFVAWAIGVARNVVRAHLRRRGRDRHLFDTDAVAAVAGAFEELATAVAARSGFLAQCLEVLEERARRLCDLRYTDDLKPAAIGERVGMSPNAVAKALQRVRERLRDCIERKLATGEA